MRGKPPQIPVPFVPYRNIPAYAGKTMPKIEDSEVLSEHPRVCGENDRRLWRWSFPGGTSPRMRGKHAQERMGESAFRNIPAYAGKTTLAVPGWLCWKGTSPRMRGKLDVAS